MTLQITGVIRQPSDATLRMARILGCVWVPRPITRGNQ